MLKSSRLVRLDTWKIMRDLPEAKDGLTTFSCQFMIEGACIQLCNGGGRCKGAGDFDLSVYWPSADESTPAGFIKLFHPGWNTLTRFVLLAGKPNLDNTPIWRLLCPITRNLEQVLYFDPASHLFVSYSAIGRRQRASDFAYFKKQLLLQLDLEIQQSKLREKYPDLDKMPQKIREMIGHPLEIALDTVAKHTLLATNSIRCDADEGIDVIALSKRPSAKYQMYLRDKSGVVKLTANAKRRLGIR
jgi:hypothetical protein